MGSKLARIVRVAAAIAAAMVLAVGCDWLQFGGDQTHSNVAIDSQITPANVGQLHQTWQVKLPELVQGQPLEATGVSTPSGTRNLLIVNGHLGGLYALDPSTGSIVWQVPQPNPHTCFTAQSGGTQPCFQQGSPAIDKATGRVYNYVPDTGQVHQYDLGTGAEITGGGWPETVTLKPTLEKMSSNLALAQFGANSYLYVTVAGFANDFGDYQGHITTINLADGSQHVFNAVCSDQAVHFVASPGSPDCPQTDGGIWGRSAVVPDTATGKVYTTTANATFDPANHDWGDTVMALNPNGTGNVNGDPLDSWTPSNFQLLQATDQDLGSAEPTLLPQVPGSRFAHLGLQVGKQGQIYLLNLDDLSGQDGPGHVGGEVGGPVAVPQGGAFGVQGQPVAWTDSDGRVWVFITTESGMCGLLVQTDSAGNPTLSTQWVISGGGTKVIAPVTPSGVTFIVVNNAIIALNAQTAQALWLAPLPSRIHMETPLVTGGSVFISDESGTITAFSLLPATASNRVRRPRE